MAYIQFLKILIENGNSQSQVLAAITEPIPLTRFKMEEDFVTWLHGIMGMA